MADRLIRRVTLNRVSDTPTTVTISLWQDPETEEFAIGTEVAGGDGYAREYGQEVGKTTTDGALKDLAEEVRYWLVGITVCE